MSAKTRIDEDMDPVERCRQARRELEQQFATADEYLDWLQRLDEERLAKERLSVRRKTTVARRSAGRSSKKGVARKSSKSRGRS
jgi:hypothetical protein